MTSQPTGILDPDEARCPAALVLIDVINPLDFPGSENLLKHALPMSERIATLKAAARSHSVPIIYVNDNFGRWRSGTWLIQSGSGCVRSAVRRPSSAPGKEADGCEEE